MRKAVPIAIVLVLASSVVDAQVPEPPSRCVQNCGDVGGNAGANGVPKAPPPSASRNRANAIEWSMDEARNYFVGADWNNAIRSIEEALDKATDDPALLAWLKRAQSGKALHSRLAAIDTSVVDVRGVERVGKEWADRIPEIARSPARDRIEKGYGCIVRHEWPEALAWWQEALARDPGNLPLKRGVELAQWMVDYRRRGGRQATVSTARRDVMSKSLERDLLRMIDAMLLDELLSESVRFAERIPPLR